MELKIPPPLYWLLCALLMWGCARIPFAVSLPSSLLLALLFLVIGVVIALSGVWACWRAQTTVHPSNPEETSAIVQNGIFGYSRNPMYLGLIMTLMAWGFYLGHPLAWIGPAIFFWLITRWQILPEERILAEKFGSSYTNYCRQIRRWL